MHYQTFVASKMWKNAKSGEITRNKKQDAQYSLCNTRIIKYVEKFVFLFYNDTQGGVYMSLLDGFNQVPLGSNSPAVSISNYGLTFNKSVLDTMSKPDYVDLFLNESSKCIAIRGTNSTTSVPFCVSKSNGVNARVNNKEFARKLFKLMEWEYRNVSYRVPGEWHSEEGVFIFNMNEAVENTIPVKDESKG